MKKYQVKQWNLITPFIEKKKDLAASPQFPLSSEKQRGAETCCSEHQKQNENLKFAKRKNDHFERNKNSCDQNFIGTYMQDNKMG